ncbi:MAG: cupin domain-containing protein [bacterium]|nr:cupin domain-containing protein [bacterium]
MNDYKVEFQSLPWQSLMKGVRFKVCRQEDRQLRLVEYTAEMEPHWCEKGHIGYILEGRLEIRFEKEVVVFSAGDGVFIPSGKEHRHIGKAFTKGVTAIFVEDV